MFFQKKATARQIGHEMENLACAYLQQQGLQLLLRNYRCRMGEIDFIMRERECIVFVEVKYRRQLQYGASVEMIHHAKQLKLIRTANYYLLKNRLALNQSARFDAVTIDGPSQKQKICWLKNIIDVNT